MSFPLEEKLVIAVASSALFDLEEADHVFRDKGQEEYRRYTRSHEETPFEKGAGFGFIRRLLSVNRPEADFEPIEVILLSKNDADTGLRVFNSLKHHGLSISRAAFTCGAKPFPYISALNACLFLSANQQDVLDAISQGNPAGLILGRAPEGVVEEGGELKIGFDFDGILADDSAEKVFQEAGLIGFHEHEALLSDKPMQAGPLQKLLSNISRIQKTEWQKNSRDKNYKPLIRTALITSRSAPAHRRVVKTLRSWDIHVDEAFFLGGIDKTRILSQYRPHIFFDDQLANAEPASVTLAAVHVPYGVANKARDSRGVPLG